MKQKDIFLKSEGDKWFERNKGSLSGVSKSYGLYKKYIKNGYKVLEIGCSSGNNLDYFQQHYNCEGYGIDPSKDAIDNGKQKYKNLNLMVGTSDKLEFEDEYFDFVIFGFCLYLVDRKLLLRSICEADRVLKNGGYLGITDFDPQYPKKRPYKYVNELFSYKMNYGNIFLSVPDYVLVDKFSFSHNNESFSEESGERVSSVILYKNRDKAYIFEEDI